LTLPLPLPIFRTLVLGFGAFHVSLARRCMPHAGFGYSLFARMRRKPR